MVLNIQVTLFNITFAEFFYSYVLIPYLWLYWRLFLIFVTETISRTDGGQPRPKYIFNKCKTNILLYRGLVHHHHRILNMLMLTSSPSFRFFPFSSLTYFRLMLASCPELSFFPSSINILYVNIDVLS